MKIKNEKSVCLIYSPDLTQLSFPDNLIIRSIFNDDLSRHLKHFFTQGEKIYSLTGHGLLVKLKESNKIRMDTLYQLIKTYQFSWINHQIHFNCGVTYTRGDINEMSTTLIFDLLSDRISLSLKNDRPEPVCLNEDTCF